MAHVEGDRPHHAFLQMTRGSGSNRQNKALEEAAVWLARLRSSEGPYLQDAFEAWYSAHPRHASAYDKTLHEWECVPRGSSPSEVAQTRRTLADYRTDMRARYAMQRRSQRSSCCPQLPCAASD
ncbi:MAG: DUF4880 domain-containing protein [Sphingomonadaceae bacterium]|nr:DUF4880 domain-containing protein [Sphingomonadaceae bacterium]